MSRQKKWSHSVNYTVPPPYQSIKAQHGILDKDIYNMGEDGYMMGIVRRSNVNKLL